MTDVQVRPKYDLEKRTLKFSKEVRDFVNGVPRTISNIQYATQLIRSSASIGANYIEATELMKIFGAILTKSQGKF